MPAREPPPSWVVDCRREIGARIQAHRIWADLTQEQLAEAAEIHRSTVQRIEGGHNDAKLSDLLRIARALRMPLWEMLRDDGRPPGDGVGLE